MEKIGEDVQKELVETYKRAAMSLCEVYKPDIIKKNFFVDMGKVFCIGTTISVLPSYMITQNVWYPVTFLAGSIASFIIYAVSFKKREKLADKITDDSMNGVDNYIAKNLPDLVTKEELIAFLQDMKMDEVFALDSKPSDELSAYDKCLLLKKFALEVSYPGYEDDLTIVDSIIECLVHDPDSTFPLEIGFMEKTMLDKAYRFYTEGIAR